MLTELQDEPTVETSPLSEPFEPRTIKRYSNRKLYDTQTKKYITLKGIKDLIDEGQPVVVIDNDTREDLSRQTAAKILVEEERKNAVPIAAIKDIVVKSRDSIVDMFKRSVQSGKEVITTVEQDVQRQYQRLLDTRTSSEEEIRRLANQLEDLIEKQRRQVEQGVGNYYLGRLAKLGFATPRDLEPLYKRVEDLELTVATLATELASLKAEKPVRSRGALSKK